MATKQSAKSKTVTRISATDKKQKKSAPAKTRKVVVPASVARVGGFFAPFTNYFKGAWYELRQVHWPTRAATWSLTGAVLAFSLFFVVVILVLDAGFKYLFELILK